jgi:hypothetical protein
VSPQPQLYMWRGIRERLIDRHDFFVTQVQARVFAQFQDIDGEADRYIEEEYHQIGRRSHPDDDGVAAAEAARDAGYGYHGLLTELHQQMILASLAGLYHQWDKDLRDFVERELRQSFIGEVATDAAWKGDVLGILNHFGWKYRDEGFFRKIDACRLIVNVYKHGNGRSLDDLLDRYPDYLTNSRHESLTVSEQQFLDVAAAFREFWEAFPERLYLEGD